MDTPVYLRDRLKAGNRIAGPALIEERASTTVLAPGDTLEVALLDVQTAAWGWNACRPGGIGLLDQREGDLFGDALKHRHAELAV